MLKSLKRFVADQKREREYRQQMVVDLLHEDSPDALRMYVVVRDDILPPLNCGIQAAHAIVDYSVEWGDKGTYQLWAAKHKTIVILGGTADQMMHAVEKSVARKTPFVRFREPDLGWKVTATAFEPMTAAKAKDVFWMLRRAR